MLKVKLSAMVIIAFLSLVCFNVHAGTAKCTSIVHSDYSTTYIVTDDNGEHTVYYCDENDVVFDTSSPSSGYSHEEVVNENLRNTGGQEVFCLGPPN